MNLLIIGIDSQINNLELCLNRFHINGQQDKAGGDANEYRYRRDNEHRQVVEQGQEILGIGQLNLFARIANNRSRNRPDMMHFQLNQGRTG